MDFYQLEALIAVAEQGSFSRAAERLFRTQSAISQAIKKLEEQLGTVLFDRRAPSLLPTEAGRTVLGYARRIVEMRVEALDAVDALNKAGVGKVRIVAIESAAHYLVPEFLRQFCRLYPETEIEVQRKPNAAILQHVLDRDADIGLMAADGPFRKLRWIELFREPLVLITSPAHRLAQEPEVRLSDLGEERFFVHHIGTQTTKRVINLFEQHHTPLHIVARLWSYEDVKEFVKEGMGVAIVPAMCVQQELHAGTLTHVALRELDAFRHVGVVYPEQPYLPRAASNLLDVIRSGHWSWSEGLLGGSPGRTDPSLISRAVPGV